MRKIISLLLVLGLCFSNYGIIVFAAPSPDSSGVELIVKLKRGKTIGNITSKHGGQNKKSINRLNVHKLKISSGTNVEKAMQDLKKDPSVEYCQLNYKYDSSYTPNDTNYSQQWGLSKIKANIAWDTWKGDNSIIIAVVDTGVDSDHPDLQANLITGYNAISNSNNANDDNGHGTHVAGIAAGVMDNSKGISGVSGKSRIMPVKVLSSSGSGWTIDIIEGVIWAADHGAKVINLSLGGPYYDQAFQDAVNYAYNKGVLVVAAAGNDNTSTPSYPAAFSNVLAVSAIDSNSNRASFSNFGSHVDVTAPGVNILSTTFNGSYGNMSGTSMACPFVAGSAALVWSKNPSLTPAEVESTLESTATDLGFLGKDANFGYGLINLEKAIISGSGPIIVTPVPTSGSTALPTSLPSQSPTPTPILAPIGSIESPDDGETISGKYSLKGWFLDANGVSKIQVLLNDAVIGQAQYGDFRPDIGGQYPAYRNAYCGFSYAIDTTTLTPGKYKLSIRETSNYGIQTDLPSIMVNVFNKPKTVNINYFLSESAAVTIDIFDDLENNIRTLEKFAPKLAGWNSAKWDGRDSNGKIVRDGVYTYRIQAEDLVGHSATISGKIIIERLVPVISNLSDSPDPFYPEETPENSFDFSLSENAKVTLKITNFNGVLVKTFSEIDLKAGANKLAWDGKDDNGVIVANGKYTYSVDAVDAFKKTAKQENGTITVGSSSLKITENTVLPNPFLPTGNNFTEISYSLSENAKVSIKIFDGSNKTIMLLEDNVSKASGVKTVSWNGKDSNGFIVPNGDYGYKISAVDNTGIEASPVQGVITIKSSTGNKLISSIEDAPDPFKPDGQSINTITLNTLETALITVEIKNAQGETVKVLPQITLNKGINTFNWDGRNSANLIVPAGTYTYKISALSLDNTIKEEVTGTITVDLQGPVISDTRFNPDPFEPTGLNTAELSYTLSEASKVSISIYDNAGHVVATLEDKTDNLKGINSVTWDGKNNSSQIVPNGLYSYKINATDYTDQIAEEKTGKFTVSSANGKDTFEISDHTVNPNPFTPDGKNATTISYRVSDDALVSVKIIGDDSTVIKQLELEKWKASGINSASWDGRVINGAIVPQGNYTYLIEATSIKGTVAKSVYGSITILDPASNKDILVSDVSDSPDPFYPDGKQNSTITYVISDNANASIGIYDSKGVLVKTLFKGSVTAGSNSVEWDGKDAGEKLVPNGNYVYKIEATDSLGNKAPSVSGTITVDSTAPVLSYIGSSPDPFEVDGINTSVMSFTISENATTSVKIYDSLNNLVRTITDNEAKGKGVNEVKWDGKDDNGSFVSEGTYTVRIQAFNGAGINAKPVSGSIKVVLPQGNQEEITLITSVIDYPDPFKPGNNNKSTISFNQLQNAYVNVTIYNNTKTAIRTITDGLSFKGEKTLTWDGKDSKGILVKAGVYSYKITAVDAQSNNKATILGTITVEYDAPKISILSISNDPFESFGSNDLEVSYSLSKEANVTTEIFDSSNTLVTILDSGVEKLSGTNTVRWNGTNLAGELVKDGQYTIRIIAADLINQTAVATGKLNILHTIPEITLVSDGPDPFRAGLNSNTIEYSLTKNALVTLTIYDNSKNVVKKLVNSQLTAGSHSIEWSGKNENNVIVPTGVYTYTIDAVDATGNKAMQVVGQITVAMEAPAIGGQTVDFTGKWKVTITQKDASWSQRVIISGSDGYDGQYNGVIGNSFVVDGKNTWSLGIEHNDGYIWEGSLLKATQPSLINNILTVNVTSEDNVLNPDDYNDLVLRVEKVVESSVSPTPASPTPSNGEEVSPSPSPSPSALPSIDESYVFPNPFSPKPNETSTVSIYFKLSEDAYVTTFIYDRTGALVAILANNMYKKAGTSSITWNGRNIFGNIVIDGIYTYKIFAFDQDGNKFIPYIGLITVDGNPAINSVSDTPDPFTPSAKTYSSIKFTLTTEANVTIMIYNQDQKLVKTLDTLGVKKESNTVTWLGTDESGKYVAEGMYIYKIQAINTLEKINCQVVGTITVKRTNNNPTNPTTPTDPTSPSLPGDPTSPTPIADPSLPTVPTNPAEPTEPADPTNPTNPGDPTKPSPQIPVISAVSDSPDPFGPDMPGKDICTIKYTVSKDVITTIKIYNSSRQLIRTLWNGKDAAGARSSSWNAKDDLGNILLDGIFIYTIEAVDNDGNKASMVTGYITLDGTPPQIGPVIIDPEIFEPIE